MCLTGILKVCVIRKHYISFDHEHEMMDFSEDQNYFCLLSVREFSIVNNVFTCLLQSPSEKNFSQSFA